MAERRLWARGWRAAVLISIGGVLGVSLITPAVAHVGPWDHNWREHIKPLVRKFGDQRWVNENDQAYAYVLRDPVSLDLSRTKGFTAVSRPFDGVYCLTPVDGIDPGSRPAIVSAEWGNSAGGELEPYWYADSSECSLGEYEVITEQAGVSSNNVAFTISVP